MATRRSTTASHGPMPDTSKSKALPPKMCTASSTDCGQPNWPPGAAALPSDTHNRPLTSRHAYLEPGLCCRGRGHSVGWLRRVRCLEPRPQLSDRARSVGTIPNLACDHTHDDGQVGHGTVRAALRCVAPDRVPGGWR